uniref:Uncharacterized protein n=1 Tax=Oryza punctata TaxID=4537 RepID=A0A0E0M867_ORYPU
MCRSCLLRKIYAFYGEAHRRLKFRVKRSLAARLLSGGGGGLCFGLLDPVTNIVVNALTTSKRRDHESLGLRKRVPVVDPEAAVHYLFVAGADLLVAVRIAVLDVVMKRFGSTEKAVREALYMSLECAALATGHPDPARLVGAWLTVSTHLDEAVRHLALQPRRRRPTLVREFVELLDKPPPPEHAVCEDPWWLWKLAVSSHVDPRACAAMPMPFQHTDLRALAKLPAGDLRSHFHRSMLMAGHCYGPLDPVSNIIVNTIWYDAAFPPAAKLELDVIGTESLHRVENRSMYGLASFLCTRYHAMDFHQAVLCFLQADANLVWADPNLDPDAAAATAIGTQAELGAALDAYEKMENGNPAFELHTICGVNDEVSGPAYLPDVSGPPYMYFHSHVNFLATPKIPHAHGASTTPFFAELSNGDDNDGASYCCPVPLPMPCAERVRCLYCDFMGARIVHPLGKSFHGRASRSLRRWFVEKTILMIMMIYLLN